MLEDRYYMRRPGYGTRRSATVVLLLVNVLAFFLQNALYRFAPGFDTDGYFALNTDGLKHGYVWQLLTFQFMHGNLLHLLGNCLAIYMFGRDVEEAIGYKSFLTLYLSSGIVGGLVQAIEGVLLPGLFQGSVVGASAGAFGLTAAFAVLYPDRVLLLFFVIPMRAKYLLVLSAVLAVVGIASPTSMGPQVAHAAHLGGIVAGVLYIRYAVHWQFRWPEFKRPGTRPVRRLVRVTSNKPAPWNRAAAPAEEELPPEEFLSKEVDPILDKISAHGIQSLTERERRILETARTKVGKR